MPVIFLTALVTGDEAPASSPLGRGQRYIPKLAGIPEVVRRIEEAVAGGA